MESRLYFVSGRVQGVGFRYFTRNAANRLGLSGYVRNLPDGRVECGARGTADQLDALESELRKGPALARVESVHSQEANLPDTGDFELRS